MSSSTCTSDVSGDLGWRPAIGAWCFGIIRLPLSNNPLADTFTPKIKINNKNHFLGKSIEHCHLNSLLGQLQPSKKITWPHCNSWNKGVMQRFSATREFRYIDLYALKWKTENKTKNIISLLKRCFKKILPIPFLPHNSIKKYCLWLSPKAKLQALHLSRRKDRPPPPRWPGIHPPIWWVSSQS